MNTLDTTHRLEALRLTDDDAADRAIDELTAPTPPQSSALEIVVRWGRELWSTPNRAAAATVWAVGAVTLVLTALSSTTRSVQTALGPARVTCGLGIYLYGDPEPAVNRACTHAESGRAALFAVSLVVVLAGLLAAGVLVGRGRLHPLSRVGTWLPALGGLGGGVAAVLALRPVPVAITQSGTVVSLRCGADTYFGGYPDRVVQAACRRAYSGQAHVLEVALVAVLIGAAAATGLLVSSGRLDRRRLCAGAAAAVLAVLALFSLRPVTVQVRGGPAPEVASCGLDTYLAGYPEAAVQDACRANYGARAAIGIPAGALALAAAGWLALRRPRQVPPPAVEEAP